MKKKILSMLLVLCMIVCLLPVTALAAAETATFIHYDAAQNPLAKTVNNDGVAKYFYVVDGLVVDTKAGVAASEDDYNIKFVYPAGGNPTIYFDDAAIVSTCEGFGIGAAAKGDAEDFTLVVESDSSIVTTSEYNSGLCIRTTGDVTITSVGKAELTVKASKQNIAVFGSAGGDLYFTDAYVNILQESGAVYWNGILLAGNVFVEGGVVEIASAGPNIWLSEESLAVGGMKNTSGTPRNVTVKNGTLISSGCKNARAAIGFDGTFTLEDGNLNISRVEDGPCLSSNPTIIEKDNHDIDGRAKGDDTIPYVVTHKHVAGADDHDCTTGATCICDVEMGTGNTAHTPAADDGDCTTDILCANPGCEQVVIAGAAAHVAGQDDGDCTTAVKCINCDADAIAAKAHEPEDGNFTCADDIPCKNCDKLYSKAGSHFGGTATCKDKAKCESCGQEYGEVGTHAGGTATCKDKAICATCGEAYGELAACKPAADDGDCTTAVKCSVCGKETTAAKTHTYTDNKDASCNNAGCTHTRTIEGTENPKTADATVLAPLFVLLAVSVFGLAIVLNKKIAA